MPALRKASSAQIPDESMLASLVGLDAAAATERFTRLGLGSTARTRRAHCRHWHGIAQGPQRRRFYSFRQRSEAILPRPQLGGIALRGALRPRRHWQHLPELLQGPRSNGKETVLSLQADCNSLKALAGGSTAFTLQALNTAGESPPCCQRANTVHLCAHSWRHLEHMRGTHRREAGLHGPAACLPATLLLTALLAC